jgi:hypothetical protein
MLQKTKKVQLRKQKKFNKLSHQRYILKIKSSEYSSGSKSFFSSRRGNGLPRPYSKQTVIYNERSSFSIFSHYHKRSLIYSVCLWLTLLYKFVDFPPKLGFLRRFSQFIMILLEVNYVESEICSRHDCCKVIHMVATSYYYR